MWDCREMTVCCNPCVLKGRNIAVTSFIVGTDLNLSVYIQVKILNIILCSKFCSEFLSFALSIIEVKYYKRKLDTISNKYDFSGVG